MSAYRPLTLSFLEMRGGLCMAWLCWAEDCGKQKQQESPIPTVLGERSTIGSTSSVEHCEDLAFLGL